MLFDLLANNKGNWMLWLVNQKAIVVSHQVLLPCSTSTHRFWQMCCLPFFKKNGFFFLQKKSFCFYSQFTWIIDVVCTHHDCLLSHHCMWLYVCVHCIALLRHVKCATMLLLTRTLPTSLAPCTTLPHLFMFLFFVSLLVVLFSCHLFKTMNECFCLGKVFLFWFF